MVICSQLRFANYNESPTVKEFGLSIDTRFQQVNARVMNPPALAYQTGQVRNPALLEVLSHSTRHYGAFNYQLMDN